MKKIFLGSLMTSAVLFATPVDAVQYLSYDLDFTSGSLSGIAGSMVTLELSDGDATGPLANWKSASNGGILGYSATIVVDSAGTTLDFQSGAAGNSLGNANLSVAGGEILYGSIVMYLAANLPDNSLATLYLNFNMNPDFVSLNNAVPAGGYSTGTVSPKSTVSVPDGGLSILLLGGGLVGLACWRRIQAEG